MSKQVCSYIDEHVLEQLKSMGFSGYRAIQDGINLLLEREQAKVELQEIRRKVNEEKFKLDRIIKEQEKIDKALTPRQQSALRNDGAVSPLGKNETIPQIATQDSEENICKKIWSRKFFMGSAGYMSGFDFTLTNDELDELYTRAKKFNHELARVLHDEVKRDYSGGFVGFSIDTVKTVDRLLHVNSFNDGKTVGV